MPPVMSPMFVYGSHTFAMFYAHAHMRYVKKGNTSHINLTTFTNFAQNSTVVSMHALYGSTIHTATLLPSRAQEGYQA